MRAMPRTSPVWLALPLLFAAAWARGAPAEDPVPPAAAPAARAAPRAQATRHDLALRLRLLEEALEANPGAFALRRRAVSLLVARATLGFFSGAYERAMDGLNEARATLLGEPFDALRAALERVRVELRPYASALEWPPSRPTVEVRLVALGAPPPPDLLVRFVVPALPQGAYRRLALDLGAKPWSAWLAQPEPLRLGALVEHQGVRLGLRLTIDLGPGGAGTLLAERLLPGPHLVARAEAAAGHARALPAALPPGSTPGLLPTAERLAERVQRAPSGLLGDTLPDLPGDVAHLERLLDRMRASAAGAPTRLTRDDLPADGYRVTASGARYRLFAPPPAPSTGPGPAPERVPLVLALHGAGGSEDMFFEAYGGGAAVRLARARGWALASPTGHEHVLEVLDDVATLLPVDPARVYLVGHSLGAGALWRVLLEAPERFAAVAPIAGGWMALARPAYERARDVPVLAVNGALDPMRTLAVLTAERAAAAGVPVTRLDLADLDHLLVVGAALPEVFRFFDQHARPPVPAQGGTVDPLPEIGSLWDWQDPAVSEQRFRDLLPRAEAEGDLGYRVTLQAQIARALGLQRRFDQAHALLDALEPLLTPESHLARARVSIERGRLWNSAQKPAQALPLFEAAFGAARQAGHDGLAVDALHMLGIAASGDAAVAWNEKAMAYAEASADPRAKAWLGALYNNLGWTCHERGELARALDLQLRNWRWHEERGRVRDTLIGKWAYARVLRSLKRQAEAVALHHELLAAWEALKEPDGYVFEELGENLLELGRAAEARPHFARACELLSQDAGLSKDEPQRLERLRTLGAEPPAAK